MACEHSRDLNRSLVGFSAAVGEKAATDLPWRDLCDFFRQRNHCFVWENGGGVLQFVHLGLDLGGNAGIRMAYGDGDDAAKEVQVLVAIDVPQVLHAGVIGDQRLGEVIGDRRE